MYDVGGETGRKRGGGRWESLADYPPAGEPGQEGRNARLDVLAGLGQLPGDRLGDGLGGVPAVAVGPGERGHEAEHLGLDAGAIGEGEMAGHRPEGQVGPGTGVVVVVGAGRLVHITKLS